MRNLSNPSEIRRIMAQYGFRTSKGLGQNFLVDGTICPRMAALAIPGPGFGALEIGPGLGILTAELAKCAEKVVAIELDPRLLPVLGDTLSEFDNIEIIHGDALKLDLSALIAERFAGLDVVVCANLPYYITSPILMALLEQRLPVRSITVLVQKEAAERLCANLPSRAAGAVTVAVRWFCEPELLFHVPRGAFLPPPNVDSAVIRLDVRQTPPVAVEDEAALFRVVKAAFSQRRKTLLNCLSAGLGMDKATAANILAAAGVPPATRAEQLSLEQFAAIAGQIK